jgi:anthranilate phosphoribosyltransferase
MPVRKELGFPTLFNLLGPLTNPCSAGRQLLGVWDDSYVMPMAESLAASGTTKSAVVHSSDGLDELSVSAPTRIVYVQGGQITEDVLCPTDIGLQRWDRSAVVAGDLAEATSFIQSAITRGSSGAVRDAILFSASMSLFLSDVASSVKEGVLIASNAIDTGAVEDTLSRWVEVSHIHTLSTDEK